MEELPYDLKAAILLCIPDLLTLKALICASPLYHAVYFAERRCILREVLYRDIEFSIVHAYLEHESTKVPLDGTNPLDGLKQYCDTKVCDIPDKRLLLSAWTFEDIVRVAYIRQLVHITTTDFCRITLAVFTTQFKRADNSLPSHSELRRIHRAIYRFQLYCNLSENTRRPRIPFFLFRTWEIEELSCILHYFILKYKTWFEAIECFRSTDHDCLAAKLVECPATRTKCYDKSPSALHYDDYKEYIVSSGLPKFAKLLRAPSDVVLCEIIKNDLITGTSYFDTTYFEDALLGAKYQDVFAADIDRERYLLSNDADGPNVAWTVVLSNRAGNGLWSPGISHWRSWGYVLWDCDRLESARGKVIGTAKLWARHYTTV